MQCNFETKLFGSFSTSPGNRGCVFFNTAFEKLKINAIYKSFKINNLRDGMDAARTLKYSGISIASPYKCVAMDYVESVCNVSSNIKAINTIVISDEGNTIGYNTDYYSVCDFLTPYKSSQLPLYILGNGGLAKTVSYVATQFDLESISITRSNWSDINRIENSIIFNCTPIEVVNYISPTNRYLTANVNTEMGMNFYQIQAKKQFKLYTGRDYE